MNTAKIYQSKDTVCYFIRALNRHLFRGENMSYIKTWWPDERTAGCRLFLWASSAIWVYTIILNGCRRFFLAVNTIEKAPFTLVIVDSGTKVNSLEMSSGQRI